MLLYTSFMRHSMPFSSSSRQEECQFPYSQRVLGVLKIGAKATSNELELLEGLELHSQKTIVH